MKTLVILSYECLYLFHVSFVYVSCHQKCFHVMYQRNRKGAIQFREMPFMTYLTHICVGKLTSIGSDKGLSPGWRQDII